MLNASEFSRRSAWSQADRKVPVPRLVGRAGKRNVEADFDDPIVARQHRLAHGDEPGMRHDLGEAADPLRLHLDIPALRPPRQRPARHLPRLLVQAEDVGLQPIGEGGAERALQPDYASPYRPPMMSAGS
jgi:hypothetical protein